jgi:Protein of unknown function (DUF4256)
VALGVGLAWTGKLVLPARSFAATRPGEQTPGAWMKMQNAPVLKAKQREELLGALQDRFENNMHRHKGLKWPEVQARLEANAGKLWSLNEMERTGGEPDVVGYDRKNDEYIFYDCSAESPKGRRSVCYDREALDARKEFKPKDAAMDMAAAMGVEILTEDQYRELQTLGDFDTKTSSWLKTPSEIRKLGGAVFADRRYDHIFVYHNGASSYYAVRGFRSSLRV